MIVIFVVGSLSFFIFAFNKDESQHPVIKKPPNSVEKLSLAMEMKFQKFFTKWGVYCAMNPWKVLFLGLTFILMCSYGLRFLRVTTSPVELWASPNSRSRIERNYFENHFGPFYRIEQVIITSKNTSTINYPTPTGNVIFGPAFNEEFLLKVFGILEDIKKLDDGSLKDICFAPLRSPYTVDFYIEDCAIQSVWGYFQDELYNFKSNDNNVNYLDKFIRCLNNPYDVDCFGTYKGPIDPAIALGGFLKEGDTLAKSPQYENATTVIITIPVDNYKDRKRLKQAMEWEKKFVTYMQNLTYNSSMLDIAFTSERSIEDELDRGSKSDIFTILVSYLIMFFYIAISLGHVESYKRAMIDSKITLGLGGIVIVLASVFASSGLIGGYLNVHATLIIFEVIPFLVLAVGVDNIFIIVQTHLRDPRKLNETQAEHIGRILGKVGPSILLTSISESICFFLGGLSDMPAVKAFALYAGMALLIDFLLQITCFISLLALDSRRQTENRWDIFCFIRGSKKSVNENSGNSSEGVLYKFFKSVYAPFIMKKIMRIFVMIIFFGWMCVSLSVIPRIEIGLDQDLSMPKDSFVLKYFQNLKNYLSIGPPTFFVLKGGGLNFSNPFDQNLICGGQGCDSNSLSTQIFISSKIPQVTYIARPANSWLDDYFDWSQMSECCNINGKFFN